MMVVTDQFLRVIIRPKIMPNAKAMKSSTKSDLRNGVASIVQSAVPFVYVFSTTDWACSTNLFTARAVVRRPDIIPTASAPAILLKLVR